MKSSNIILFLAALSSPLVVAQTVEDKLDESSDFNENENTIEKVITTGTHIRSGDSSQFSPLKVLDSELLEATANTTLAELLKEDTAFDSVDEKTGYIRFHGQHAGNVLILLNGLNLPKKDGGFYTSIRSLPPSVLERVEVLKEGGSATYGSDAMAGVINFITRTDLNGGNLSFSTTIPEIGSGIRQSYNASWGRSFSGGDVLGMIQYSTSQSVSEYDLNSFNRENNALRRPISDGLLTQGEVSLDIGEFCEEDICQADSLQFRNYQDDSSDVGVLLTGNYELSDKIDLSLLGMFNRTEREITQSPLALDWSRQTSAGDRSLDTALLSQTRWGQQLIARGVDLSSGPIELNYNPTQELGPQIRNNIEHSYTVQSKLEGSIEGTWRWSAQSGFSNLSNESHMTGGNANQNILRQMIYDGDFVPGQNSNLSQATVDPTYRVQGNLLTTRLLANGQLGNWGHASFGLDGRWENFQFHNDEILTTNSLLTSPVRNYSGTRNVYSAFGELETRPLKSLSLRLSTRFDSYSDMGNTFNPKFSLSFRPSGQWLFRGSVGTGFRAPGITDLHRGNTRTMALFTDRANCREPRCARGFYPLENFVSPNLKAETSIHYNMGLHFRPNKNFELVLDQWNFLGDDTISLIRPAEYTYLESRGYTEELSRLGVVTRRNSAGELQSIRTPHIINMGEKNIRGVDLDLNYGIPVFQSTYLNLNTSFSYVFEYKFRTFDFEPLITGWTTWKNTSAVSLRRGEHYGRIATRIISSIPANERRRNPKLPRTAIFDATYAYSAFWGGKISLGIKNLFDERPPVDDTGEIVSYGALRENMRSLSALGRRYYMGYSRTF